jgi:hypothetical protein
MKIIYVIYVLIFCSVALFSASPKEMAEIHAFLNVWFAGTSPGLCDRAPIVREVLSLREAALAHEHVLIPGGNGKIVLSTESCDW